MTNTTYKKPKKVDFYIRPFRESIDLIRAKLSGSAFRIMEFMSACCTFAEEVVFMPPAKELAEILNMGLSTVYNCLKRIEETCPFLQFQKNSCFIIAYRTNPNRSKKFFDFQNQESFSIQKNHFQKYRKNSQSIENLQLEIPLDKDSEPPQTLQKDQTIQTGLEVDEKINKEQEKKISLGVETKAKSFSCLPNHAPKTIITLDVTQKKHEIPEDLAERLRMSQIPLSDEVINKIAQHHISQAYGAVTHVENTWTTIRDPKAVFLYQISRQPIEQLGQRYSDELLNKQKLEQKRIDDEIARGRPPISLMPGYQAVMEKLKKKSASTSKKIRN